MNCDCISKIREALTKFHTEKGLIVQEVKVPTLIKLDGSAMDDVTYTDVRIRTDKGNKVTTINHSFCPFCGTSITKNVETDANK